MTSEEDRLRQLEDHLSDYAIAIADVILRDGIPVTSDGPCTYADQAYADAEAELTLRIPDDYAARSISETCTSMSLDWTSVSGWSLYLEFQTAENPHGHVERWFGAGLVPRPEQVANFLANAMVDWQSAGSTDQPFYRVFGQDLGPLFDRLAPYVSDSESKGSFGSRFLTAHRQAAHRWTVADLLSDEEVRAVPMRTGEANALRRLLDWLTTESDGRLRRIALGLADDIQARFIAGSTPPDAAMRELIDSFQTAWEQARVDEQDLA